jgi:hypothetical protein
VAKGAPAAVNNEGRIQRDFEKRRAPAPAIAAAHAKMKTNRARQWYGRRSKSTCQRAQCGASALVKPEIQQTEAGYPGEHPAFWIREGVDNPVYSRTFTSISSTPAGDGPNPPS